MGEDEDMKEEDMEISKYQKIFVCVKSIKTTRIAAGVHESGFPLEIDPSSFDIFDPQAPNNCQKKSASSLASEHLIQFTTQVPMAPIYM